ncbi:hypothetical protein [Spiroplasma endosymbiont of Virgichneumon dumeticola]|uniref:hypothetical protein n=1 Tax=Spiroplasma endosymbiont of Virgichneumon dumeticola TaxID=3139323 RepID=UPI0035C92248
MFPPQVHVGRSPIGIYNISLSNIIISAVTNHLLLIYNIFNIKFSIPRVLLPSTSDELPTT